LNKPRVLHQQKQYAPTGCLIAWIRANCPSEKSERLLTLLGRNQFVGTEKIGPRESF
jgi:hypothetical protein